LAVALPTLNRMHYVLLKMLTPNLEIEHVNRVPSEAENTFMN